MSEETERRDNSMWLKGVGLFQIPRGEKSGFYCADAAGHWTQDGQEAKELPQGGSLREREGGFYCEERKGVKAVIIMATPCTSSLGDESGGSKI